MRVLLRQIIFLVRLTGVMCVLGVFTISLIFLGPVSPLYQKAGKWINNVMDYLEEISIAL